MQLHGGDIESFKEKYGIYPLDFSAGISPLGMPKSVELAIIKGIKNMNIYPDDKQRALKKAISEFENVDKNNIICGCGAIGLIYSLIHGIKPGKILIPVPSFGEYEKAALSTGCRVAYHLLKEEEEFSLGEDILENIDESIDMVFICQPNNPTGKVVERNLLIKILDKCCEVDAVLVVDECFVDFLENPSEYSMKCIPENDNLFILKAFTKTFAMAGIRLGYGITSNAKLLEAIRAVTPAWSVSGFAQIAGVQATKETEYINELRELINTEKQWLLDKIRNIGIAPIGYDANYIFFKSIPDLADRLGKLGILIRSCESFANLGKGYFRICIRKREDNAVFIQALTKVLKEDNEQ